MTIFVSAVKYRLQVMNTACRLLSALTFVLLLRCLLSV